MAASLPGDRVSLSIPPDPRQIATIRSFAFAVGRHEAWREELVEDVKLALSEVAAGAIEAGGDSEIVVAIESVAAGLHVTVRSSGVTTTASSGTADRKRLIKALFPTLEVQREGSAEITKFTIEG